MSPLVFTMLPMAIDSSSRLWVVVGTTEGAAEGMAEGTNEDIADVFRLVGMLLLNYELRAEFCFLRRILIILTRPCDCLSGVC
mmetsp:Transcript_31189/g.47762  ORF Transcript_31189/g.47762 Transcript_31189/m.47762 type:complete len:83 (+) Transcript_31189:337-585(+)